MCFGHLWIKTLVKYLLIFGVISVIGCSDSQDGKRERTIFSLLRMEHQWNFLTIGRKLNIEKTVWTDFRGCFPHAGVISNLP
jgi:hypothetical protein